MTTWKENPFKNSLPYRKKSLTLQPNKSLRHYVEQQDKRTSL